MKTEQTPGEVDHVRRHTSPEVLQRIDDHIERSIRFYATQPDHVIKARVEALENEWDIERRLGTNASILGLTGALLGLTLGRKWLLLTCTVTGFLLRHSIEGWCPPVPLMRKMGVRTRSEIDREKFALKALRGDFKHLEIKPRENVETAPVPQIMHAVNL